MQLERLAKADFLREYTIARSTDSSRTRSCDLDTFLLQLAELIRWNPCVSAEMLGKMTGIGKTTLDRNIKHGVFFFLK